MNILNIYEMIFEDVFCKTFSKSFYIFLCGGAEQKHIRNKIRLLLEKKGFQILYPEDLFMDMLNRDKKADLLEYENLLADNSDVVCIICESMGSAVELGAFIQNNELEQKIVVCINQKFSRDKSFIMVGPVKHLNKINNGSVFFYKEHEPEQLAEKLIKKFSKMQNFSEKINIKKFDNLSVYIVFISMIIYFFKTVKRKELHKTLRELIEKKEKNKISLKDYNKLFNASIKYLVKSGKVNIRFDNSQNDEILFLSKKGYIETCNLLKLSLVSNRTILQDKIRCVILKEQLNI